MSFILTHQRRDGSIERKRVTINSHQTPEQAERMIAKDLQDRRKRLHDRKGWSKDRQHKLVAHIPNVVVEEVFLNDGADAARDPDWLMKRCRELGFDPRMQR